MSDLVMFVAAAALAGVCVGLFAGFFSASRRNRRRLDEVGVEVGRLRALVEGKLAEDDPDLPAHLKDLNAAVEKAYRAVDALEGQSALIREKSASLNDARVTLRGIVSMMEDMGANMPYVPAAKVKALSNSLESGEKEPPRLR